MKRLLLVLACVSTAMANTVTLTMDEVTTQPINGLAVTKGGITFTFSDAGGNLNYDTVGAGILTYEQDPAITGPPEPFVVAFSVPISTIQFGMSGGPQHTPATPIATVSFYNGATLITTVALNSSLTDPYPEGQLNYTSATPVTSMTVTPSTVFVAIGFDNLRVTTPSLPVPAASPLTLALMTLGIVGLGGYALRRRFGPSSSH
jgi:hypothetical protein